MLRHGRGVAHVDRGSCFSAVLVDDLRTDRLKAGSRVELELAADIVADGSLIANRGARLKGWISRLRKPRCSLAGKLPDDRFLDSNADLSIFIERLVDIDGSSIELKAEPAAETRIAVSSDEQRLFVDSRGSIRKKSDCGKYAGAQVAIGAVSLAARPLSILVGPILSTGAAVADPGYGYGRKLESPDELTRLKAAGRGFLKGLPGSFLYFGFEEKGDHVLIPAGTEFGFRLCEDLILDSGRIELTKLN